MNPCACHDCFETSAGGPGTRCWECVDADCLAYNPEDIEAGIPSYVYECQRSDAYGRGDWSEAMYDPDGPWYDTLEEMNGNA